MNFRKKITIFEVYHQESLVFIFICSDEKLFVCCLFMKNGSNWIFIVPTIFGAFYGLNGLHPVNEFGQK